MRLPPDNRLTLTLDDPFVLDGADASALTDDDVLALLPAWVRRANSRVRDALIRQARRYWQWVHNRNGFVLNALRTPRHASGQRLDAHGKRKRRPRAPGESDAAYRERLLSQPEVITPNAIRGAARAIVRAERAVDPVVIEAATEGVFAGTTTSPWIAFAQHRGSAPLWGLYPDNVITTVGAWLPTVQQSLGPAFVVLLEGAVNSGVDIMFVMTADADPDLFAASSHVGDASAPVAWAFMPSAERPLEQRVIADIESRRGGGVVWVLFIVPNLGGAL